MLENVHMILFVILRMKLQLYVYSLHNISLLVEQENTVRMIMNAFLQQMDHLTVITISVQAPTQKLLVNRPINAPQEATAKLQQTQIHMKQLKNAPNALTKARVALQMNNAAGQICAISKKQQITEFAHKCFRSKLGLKSRIAKKTTISQIYVSQEYAISQNLTKQDNV